MRAWSDPAAAFVPAQTKGAGVHMCLNSLADDKLTASVRCIAPNGHLLEIGKYDILKGTALSMRPMHDNITFHGINLDSLFKGAQKMAVRAHLLLHAPRWPCHSTAHTFAAGQGAACTAHV